MKTITAITVTALLGGLLAVSAKAQNHTTELAAALASPAASTTMQLHVADEPNAMSAQKIASAGQTSHEVVAASLSQAIAKLVADNANGSTDLLRTGQVMNLNAKVGSDLGITEQHSVNVHISYDARPVGGILSIKVELVPIFGGIGSAVRPTASREFAQAVDNFDDDFISQTITSMTNELAAEYAAK